MTRAAAFTTEAQVLHTNETENAVAVVHAIGNEGVDYLSRYRMRMSGVSGEISLMTAMLRAGVVNEVITWERYVRRSVTQ